MHELSSNTTDISHAVCQTLIEARCDLVLVDEIHNLNLATSAGEDMSDHLKYFTEHLPATFIYAGINVERQGLLTGVRGKQIAGRCVLINSRPFPYQAEWKQLVAAMEGALRLHQHKPGSLTELSKYLHRRTGGMIGSLYTGSAPEQSARSRTTARPSPANSSTRSPSTTPPSPKAETPRDLTAALPLLEGPTAAGLAAATGPLLDETLNSYLSRLAKVNHLATSSLRELLSGSKQFLSTMPAQTRSGTTRRRPRPLAPSGRRDLLASPTLDRLQR
ncbi:hypothetical protein [Nonomuraea sp. NPDC050691]|uniref:hypothetical protein n=1 Tax=Nonomuraea sp. NPDC050691 TaxID=3155661 RepID=UPI003405CC6D